MPTVARHSPRWNSVFHWVIPQDPPLDRAHQGERVVRDRLVVGADRRANDDAVAGRRIDVDGVEADTPAGDHAEIRGLAEHALGVGLAARKRREHAGERAPQLLLGHLALAADAPLDVEPGGLEASEVRRFALVGVGHRDQDAARGHRSGLSHRGAIPSRAPPNAGAATSFDGAPARA
jgi:hypothetical protein